MLCVQPSICQAAPRHYTVSTPPRLLSHQCKALPAAAAASLAIAFLPWSGCSQGGFYATGVAGIHGKDCQAMYQPAAAAEERLAARLRQQVVASQPQDTNYSDQATPPSESAGSGPSSRCSSQGASSAISSSSSSSPSKQEDMQQPDPQQLTAAEHMQQVPDAAKELVRDILHEDNRQRTKQLVDDAWQTLE